MTAKAATNEMRGEFQLYRWGQPYHCFGSREGIIDIACSTYGHYWWWLRLCGWYIGEPE